MKFHLMCFLSCLLLLGISVSSTEDDSSEASVTSDDEIISEAPATPEEDIIYVTPKPSGSVYLAEHFDDDNSYRKRWVISQTKKEDIDESIAKYDGLWDLDSPLHNGLKGDMGLVLKSKAKHSAISAKLDRPFHFVDEPLVLQYEVTFQNGQECGGAYVKLLSHLGGGLDLKKFHDKTQYTIMFGPDKCGNDYKLHFIFQYKSPLNGTYSEKHSKQPTSKLDEPYKDKLPHLYGLVIKPDNTYEMYLDKKLILSGNLLEDISPPVNPPSEIEDNNDVKPADWDEREKIPDPESIKPEDWDEDAPEKIPDGNAHMPDGWLDAEAEMIPDPNAEKPEDWDEEMDGTWEAPLIDNPTCQDAPGCGPWSPPLITNPSYRGKWKPAYITNPNYKGKWRARKIPNPEFFEEKHPFKMTPIAAIGLELWSMTDSILFDNIIITHDKNVADQWAADSFDLKLKKANKDSETMVQRLVNYTNKNPWLWAVYVVVLGLPVVLVIAFCWTPTEKKPIEDSKKTDLYTADDVPSTSSTVSKISERAKKESEVIEEVIEEEKEEEDEEEDEVKDDEVKDDEEKEQEVEDTTETAEPTVRSSPRRRARRE